MPHHAPRPDAVSTRPRCVRAARAVLAIVAISTGIFVTRAGEPKPEPAALDHRALGRILADTVVDGRVDYDRLRERHAAALGAYLQRLARLDPRELAQQERLAMYLNLYNASMLAAVLDRWAPGYAPSDDAFAIFDEPLVRVGGKRHSLNQLENEIIRPEFHEPRIHVALVCAARSCPPLLPRAYVGEDLDAVLEENMRRFVKDSARNRIDAKNKALELSRIFEWYAEDFGGPGGVPAYVSRYAGVDTSSFSVTFLPYSWELNRVPR